MKKTCTICNLEKDTNNGDFQIRKTPKGTIYFRGECNVCWKFYQSQYRSKNKQNKKIWGEKYRETNKITIKAKKKDYCEKNKIVIRVKNKNRKRKRYQNDPSFRIKSIMSKTINKQIKSNGFSKSGKSTTKYLQYSFEELKKYLEKQFEPWMTWDNHGRYNSEIWDNNDQSTWTWQLDHIIPQSNLQYNSMEDNNFKKCWALENLRPYSAKQNWLDGILRIRHGV